jgi:flavodoxin I
VEGFMNVLVVYDSLYGNTQKIAEAIAGAAPGEARLLRVNEVPHSELGMFELVVVGSPTQGGKPTKATQEFLDQIPLLSHVRVAAFDTRLNSRFAKVFGFAAGKIAESLKECGGELVAEPKGFLVKGKEGPLVEGELERAAAWSRSLLGKG